MKLKDCVVTQRHIRGVNVVFLFGDRALNADEAAELRAEYIAAVGPRAVPGYASSEGWQTLDEKVAEPMVEVEDPAPPKAKKAKV